MGDLSRCEGEFMKLPCRNAQITIWLSAVFSLLALGCASHEITVEVPPRIDLHPYQTIGIMEFSSNSGKKLNQFATQKFESAIQSAQPGVRFLELGPENEVLKSVGRYRLDPDTVKAIGQKYGVSTIFSGSYTISHVKPRVSFGESLSSVSASANVSVSMVSKQWDTGTGATIWTNSRQGQWQVARVHKDMQDPISFRVSNPEDRYEQFVGELVYALTNDFRPHYERRQVAKQ
jgi:hypothetical protein